jgi:hypothetical protein
MGTEAQGFDTRYPWSILRDYRDNGQFKLHETTYQGRKRTCYISKSSVFWDIMPCSPLKNNQSFGGIFRLHLLGRSSVCYLLHTCSSLAYSTTLKWRQYFPPKSRCTFHGLHDVIPQEIELCTTTAVRTSNPTWKHLEGTFRNLTTATVCPLSQFSNVIPLLQWHKVKSKSVPVKGSGDLKVVRRRGSHIF